MPPRPDLTADPEDPLGLVEHLRATGRFARDTKLGRLLHPGRVSLRELTAEDSLHLVLSSTRLSAHRDRFSPLRTGHDGWIARYSLTRALAHLLGIVLDGARRLVTGRMGAHRVELDCALTEVAEVGTREPDG